MSGSKQQIKKRIEKIAEFTAELKKLKIKSIFMIISCFVLSLVSNILGIYYNNNRYDFQGKQIVYEDLMLLIIFHFMIFSISFIH